MSEKAKRYRFTLPWPGGTFVLASYYDALLARFEAILPLAKFGSLVLQLIERSDLHFDRVVREAMEAELLYQWRSSSGLRLPAETDLARRGREALGGGR